METSPPPHSPIDLSSPLYYQLVHTLTDLLPPPLDDTQAALRARNQAAIAKVAALLPVNANEADLAAQCIAARAQAEDVLRLLRQHADDIGLVIRLNAQYASMLRASLATHGRLMRVQALRRKREATEDTAYEDSWVQHVAERSMLTVADPNSRPQQVGWPGTVPNAAPIEAPSACEAQTIEDDVSEDEMDSQNAAFETWLSAQASERGSRDPGETAIRKRLREAMAGSRLAESRVAGPGLSANGP